MTGAPLSTRREVVSLAIVGLSGCLWRVRRAKEKATGEWEKKKDILGIYQASINSYNGGIETIERALSYEAWSKQARAAEGSTVQLRESVEGFDRTASLASGMGEESAARIGEEATRKAELTLRAATLLVESSEERANGNGEKGDTLWREYEQYRNEAGEYEIKPSREFRHALGLR